MPNFCPKCGAAVGAAKFCPSCGNSLTPVAAAPTTPQVQGKVPTSKGSTGLKVILVGLALFAIVSFAAVVGLFYYAKRSISSRMADLKQRTGIDFPAAVGSSSGSTRSGEARDGCLLMTKAEAEHILGLTLVRIDGSLKASSSVEHCEYYADPKAIEGVRNKTAERFQNPANSKSAQDGLAQAEELTKGMVAGVNDGSAPILVFTVHRGDAKAAMFGMTVATKVMGGKPETIPGPWDQAVFGPMDSTLLVRKGDNGVFIDLRQVPKGRERGLEMARVIVPRL